MSGGVYVKNSEAEKAKEILLSNFGEDIKTTKKVDFRKGQRAFLIFVSIFFGMLALVVVLALITK